MINLSSLSLEFWYSLIGIANIIIFAIIGIYKFIFFMGNKRKMFRPNLEIDCQYPKSFKFKLIRRANKFEWGILKFIITNTGSETAVINNVQFLCAKQNIKPAKVLRWDTSIYVKEKEFIIGPEFLKGVMSLPRLAHPFALKPQDSITLFVLVRPDKGYLDLAEITVRYSLFIELSNKNRIAWGPIDFCWISEEKFNNLAQKAIKSLGNIPLFDTTHDNS